MKHAVTQRKFGRVKNQRTAFMRGLALALINEERITTTVARAKSLRPYVEKLVTRGRDASVASHRLLTSFLGNQPEAAKKLIETISPRYKDRQGGYTRVIKLTPRKGDGSPMAIIEFVK